MGKLDLSVIILTYNEEIHIRRCLEKICEIARDIFIVDSYSTDRTLEIAQQYDGVHILKHKWENNHAKQFNWGLEHANIKTEWVLRIDADEYLLPDLIEELIQKLPSFDESVSGLVMKRRHIFMGKWMKRGVYPVKLLRIFRYGKAVCEQRLMDEHIQLLDGNVVELENDFCDHNLNNLSWFCQKHVGYAIREAADLLEIELGISGNTSSIDGIRMSEQANQKRAKKLKYAKAPLFWRAFIYFLYRYFLKLGFLDGKEGFLWHFLQGWWYRTLVDAKVYEIKKVCGNDKVKIAEHLRDVYFIDVK